ncbi:PEP/pyruvate-binding domain-containing protein [Geodermatophilus sabuli]|uniref:Pyruvate, water dikinase n=1 Tax=Geodermatophilus sabuli TaxID=1564158 RepID=A0A285EHX0_9ACTN|nr:PEP/pyruvate-binding domain-containing protein [Geodermatophilus sabuli]MBB3083962.1 pyruvate,water dikinase [Geodermatophilus sabuli]SNX98610.1 pyruvate, water dikinase [Geodermatophilus sabuli]
MGTTSQVGGRGEDTPPLVVGLRDVDAGAGERVGGKAANLGELIGAGLPVPDGFCVTTDAYRDLAAAADLTDVIDALADTAADDLVRSAELARRARDRIVSTPVPAHVAQAVTAAYRELGGSTVVAVRSSATAEDLPFASAAGQQDTFLGVVGADAVLDAVHRCWASLWTDRAVVYRVRNGIDHATTRLAVVVQRMVDSAVAGVLFTVNPVTGRRGETVVDASPGLGEAVVSGAVNPDHFVLDSRTGAVLERRLGDKRLVVRARAGGGTETVPQPASEVACLSDDQLRALVRLGARVQQHYGQPQDTEWAIDGAGALWLTQARPVTTLFPLLDGDPAGDGIRVFFCFSLAQGLTRPLTPLGVSAIRLIGSSIARLYGRPPADPVAGPPAIREAAGRLFFDVTPILRSSAGRAVVPRVLDVMEARSATVLRGLFGDPRLSVVHPSWAPVVRRLAEVAARSGIPLQVVQAVARPAAARRRLDRLGAGLRARPVPPASATPARRLEFVVGLLGEAAVRIVPRVAPPAATGFAMLWLAGRLLGADARPGDLATVLRGLPHNVTTEMDLALWSVATAVRADEAAAAAVRSASAAELAERYRTGTLPRVLQDRLRDFLDRYGHRAVAEIDVGLPRWAEDPAHVIGVLGNYLRLDDPDRAPDRVFDRGAAEARAMVSTLTERALRRGRLRGRAVGFALDRARQLAGIRELPKYLIVQVLAQARRELLAIGAELAAAGRLADAADVSFLDPREVAAALDGRDVRDVVAGRRAGYDREMRRRHVPRVLLSDGTEPEARAGTPPAADGALVGTPASAGTATGPARVVLDPVGAHLVPGEVLVAPSTDPGWTPLFLTAGALVMEMGGANSHGAVVAREYGIPAVVGVPDATGRIATGQQLTVDGTRGLVSAVDGELQG